MKFGRTPAPALQTISPAAAVAAVPAPDDGSIPLIDFLGQGFELLREIDLGHSLWRVELAADLDPLASGQIVVVAAYTPEDIESSRPLMQRFMTIVLAMGLGPHYGSRALALGAVGYVDANTDEGTIRGVFGDAVARVRIRRLRTSAA
jgi:hypothetical protein